MKSTINSIANSRCWSWLLVSSIGAAAVIMGSIAWAASDEGDTLPPVIQDPADAPVPYFHPYVSFDGTFFVHRWDDREIGDEAKRADPLYNPSWVPLSQCLADGGLEVRSDPNTKYNQDDIDRLVERVNMENPDRVLNLKTPPKPTGSAGIFTRCAEEWLTKSPAEIEALTGVTEAGPR